MKKFTMFLIAAAVMLVACGNKASQKGEGSKEANTVQKDSDTVATATPPKKYEYLRKCSVYAIKKECKDKMKNVIEKGDEWKSVAPDFVLSYMPVVIRLKETDFKIAASYSKYNEAIDAMHKNDEENPPAYFIGTLYHFVNHFEGKTTTNELVENAIKCCMIADEKIANYDKALESIDELREELALPY